MSTTESNLDVMELPASENPPELIINESEMLLNGLKFLTGEFDWIKKADFPGSTEQRVARGGTPPYRYSSSAPAIAGVDSITGVVSSLSNGSAFITVTDSSHKPQSKSYPVRTSNVYYLRLHAGSWSAKEADEWIKSIGGLTLELDDHLVLNGCYETGGSVPPERINYHTGKISNDFPNLRDHPVVLVERRLEPFRNFNQGISLDKNPELPAICRKLA